MRSRPRSLASLAVASVLLTLAACGDDPERGPGEMGEMPEMSEMGEGHDMADMDDPEHMAMMNDPDAVPADEVDGEVTSGEFVVLDTAPPGSDAVAGRAWQAQNGDGTTVTIRLEGLEPGTDYLAHLHEQACETDAGGDHFQFDADGGELPPNEVHLALTADEDGTGEATVTHDRRTGDDAPAVVIHPVDSMENRLACADFS